jgi:hypothetical protein
VLFFRTKNFVRKIHLILTNKANYQKVKFKVLTHDIGKEKQ